jgi:hypothetical protein
MTTTTLMPLELLYDHDETAWLEIMSALAADGRFTEMDHFHLAEYLSDMAKRDRREVLSRLIVLLAHLLKWEHQPNRRTVSWKSTIREQRRELRQLLESGTLRNHAEAVLEAAYEEACEQVAEEASVKIEQLPERCPWSLDGAMELEIRDEVSE